MILSEILDQKYPWKTVERTNGFERAKFVTDDGSPVVVYLSNEYMDLHSLVQVSFSRNSMQGMTGAGDQFKILSTVIDILKDYVHRIKPSVVAFSADKEDKSRVSVYQKLTTKNAPKDYAKINSSEDVADEDLRAELDQWLKDNRSNFADFSLIALVHKEYL